MINEICSHLFNYYTTPFIENFIGLMEKPFMIDEENLIPFDYTLWALRGKPVNELYIKLIDTKNKKWDATGESFAILKETDNNLRLQLNSGCILKFNYSSGLNKSGRYKLFIKCN